MSLLKHKKIFCTPFFPLQQARSCISIYTLYSMHCTDCHSMLTHSPSTLHSMSTQYSLTSTQPTHCQLYPYCQLDTHSLTFNLTLTHSPSTPLSTQHSTSTWHSFTHLQLNHHPLAIKSTLTVNLTLRVYHPNELNRFSLPQHKENIPQKIWMSLWYIHLDVCSKICSQSCIIDHVRSNFPVECISLSCALTKTDKYHKYLGSTFI